MQTHLIETSSVAAQSGPRRRPARPPQRPEPPAFELEHRVRFAAHLLFERAKRSGLQGFRCYIPVVSAPALATILCEFQALEEELEESAASFEPNRQSDLLHWLRSFSNIGNALSRSTDPQALLLAPIVMSCLKALE